MRKMFGWSKVSRMPSKYIHLVDTDVKNILLELNGELPKEEKDTSLKQIIARVVAKEIRAQQDTATAEAR